MEVNPNFWRGKKVFLTGHTGFKGSWLSFFLLKLGAKVYGYSLGVEKYHYIFKNSKLNKKCKNFFSDIRDKQKLNNAIKKTKPNILFHLAAQPLVIDGFKNPLDTFEINFNGTLNILECIKKNKIKSSVIVTTDKVYFNDNKKISFKEEDLLGGEDPYSTSKVTAEHVISLYQKLINPDKKFSFASARAGNVIGGGDRAENRIVPDFFRSLKKNKNLKVRNPFSTRPWQHVLDPLQGYLILAERLYKKKIKDGSWNFGPKKSNNINVKTLVENLNKNFGIKINYVKSKNNFKEKKYLQLSSLKANKKLKWKSKLNINKTIQAIIEWEAFALKNKTIDDICLKQIEGFLKLK